MDPYEIEDTSDWLGSPSRLETVQHYASMLEEDIQALRLELRAAKENISGLVAMNDQLSSDLTRARTWLANREAETTEQLSEIQSLTLVLDQKKQNHSSSTSLHGRPEELNKTVLIGADPTFLLVTQRVRHIYSARIQTSSWTRSR